MTTAARLHMAILAVCPIHGVSIGRVEDKATWRIDYTDEATVEQREAAQAVMGLFEAGALVEPKAQARTRINAARDAAISAGVTFGGVAYDSDPESRAALNAALTVLGPAGAVPQGFTWRAADNTDQALTLAELYGLAAVMLDHGYAQHVKARALKDAIEAAATLAEVNAITWES